MPTLNADMPDIPDCRTPDLNQILAMAPLRPLHKTTITPAGLPPPYMRRILMAAAIAVTAAAVGIATITVMQAEAYNNTLFDCVMAAGDTYANTTTQIRSDAAAATNPYGLGRSQIDMMDAGNQLQLDIAICDALR